jgi:hypothetical protein
MKRRVLKKKTNRLIKLCTNFDKFIKLLKKPESTNGWIVFDIFEFNYSIDKFIDDIDDFFLVFDPSKNTLTFRILNIYNKLSHDYMFLVFLHFEDKYLKKITKYMERIEEINECV